MFVEYEDEDIELVFFDMADAQKVRTVLDVIRFLRNQGQDHLVDYYNLMHTFGINPDEFPCRN